MARNRPPTKSRASQHQVTLGHVTGVFGVRGELRIFLHNRESDLLRKGREVWLVSPEGDRRAVFLVARSGAQSRVLAKVQGVDSPEEAAKLVGWEILVDRASLPPTGPDEYYQHDLIGMRVLTASGQDLGQLTHVQPGEVDVWTSQIGDTEYYIPAKKEVVLGVDLVAGIIRVDDVCASTS